MTNPQLANKPHATIAWVAPIPTPELMDEHAQAELLIDARNQLETTAAREGRKLAGPITARVLDSVLPAGSKYGPPPGCTFVRFICDTTPADGPHED